MIICQFLVQILLGTPDAIDSSDYVMTIIRAIRKFPAERKKEVDDSYNKSTKDMKEDKLKLEKAYHQGYVDALGDIDSFIQTTSRGI